MKTDACLRLVLPQSLEDQVIDHLLQHQEWIGPFITHPVDGHGTPGGITSAAEQVRGRAARVQVEILIDADHVQELIDHLRADLAGADIVWWLAPVLGAGSFA